MTATLVSCPARVAVRRSIGAAVVGSLAAASRAMRGLEPRPIETLSDQLLADIGLSRAHLLVDSLPRTGGAVA